jgi:hypothetical protein
MVKMELISFIYGVIVTTIGFLIGIAIKISMNDIIYYIAGLLFKTEDDKLKIKDLPINDND